MYGCVINGEELKKMIEKGEIIIDPFDESLLTPSGIDLRLGFEFATIKPVIYNEVDLVKNLNEIEEEDIKLMYEKHSSSEYDGYIIFKPKTFTLTTTMEYVKLPPNVIALCELRSTLARYGLVIPPTVVDCGFEGELTIEVINLSSITYKIRRGTKFLHMIFLRTCSETQYVGKYKGQRGVRLPKPLKD